MYMLFQKNSCFSLNYYFFLLAFDSLNSVYVKDVDKIVFELENRRFG